MPGRLYNFEVNKAFPANSNYMTSFTIPTFSNFAHGSNTDHEESNWAKLHRSHQRSLPDLLHPALPSHHHGTHQQCSRFRRQLIVPIVALFHLVGCWRNIPIWNWHFHVPQLHINPQCMCFYPLLGSNWRSHLLGNKSYMSKMSLW